jgi:hypothetical protein
MIYFEIGLSPPPSPLQRERGKGEGGGILLVKKIKILGISGSPRKANTDLLLEEALKSAGTLEGIVTERIYLRDTQIRFCIGCFKCFDETERLCLPDPSRFDG